MFLWRVLASEEASICHTSTVRDYKQLTDRVKHEGSSFLTITLPTLSKALEAGLERGVWDPSDCAAFKHRGGLPLFLGGFLDRVFARGTGRLLDQPCVDSISAVRQLSLLAKKIQLPCSDARTAGAMQGYVELEQEVAGWDWSSAEAREEFKRMSLLLFADVFADVDRKVFEGNIIPKHGPGTTAERILGNQKYVQQTWPHRLDAVFPYEEWALPNLRYALEVDRVTFLEPDAERPVRVISVPKTLEKPRIIAAEPVCMQFLQQAVKDAVVPGLESKRLTGNYRENLAYQLVGFTDQNPNREMAKEGSLEGGLATLDLSEASDRVSNLHVIDLLSYWPHFGAAVQATRSTKADVPGHGVIHLTKFASMGSALTFPIEAAVFLTAVMVGIQRQSNRQLTRSDIIALKGRVRVYGDDIVVPVEYVSSVIESLEALGLKVNARKSFWNGKFRESCGGDYFDGHWVTPVYVRRLFPTNHRDVPGVESLVSLRNQFYFAGLWKTARYLDKIIGRVLWAYPVVEPSSAVLGRHSVLSYRAEKQCPRLHRPLVRGFVAKYRIPKNSIDGFDALYKSLSLRGDEPSPSLDEEHLERSGRGRVVGLQHGWWTPY